MTVYTPDQLARTIDGLRRRTDPIAPGVGLRIAEAYEHQLAALQAEVAELQRALTAARRAPPSPPEPPALTLDDAFAAQQAAVEGASARLVEMAQPAPEPPPVALPPVVAPPPRLPKLPPPPRARA